MNGTVKVWLVLAPLLVLLGYHLKSTAVLRVPMAFNEYGNGGTFVDPDTHAKTRFLCTDYTSNPRRYGYKVADETRAIMPDSEWPWRAGTGWALMMFGCLMGFAAWHARDAPPVIPFDPGCVGTKDDDELPDSERNLDRIFSEEEVMRAHQDAAAAETGPYAGQGEIKLRPMAKPYKGTFPSDRRR